MVSLRNAEAVHILGRLSTGGNAGWCLASSPDISRSRLSIRRNTGRGCASSPKLVYRYMSRAACREEATLVSLPGYTCASMAGCRQEAMSVGGEQARPSMGAGTQLGWVSTGGDAGRRHASSTDTSWSRLSIGRNAGRCCTSSPKHVCRYCPEPFDNKRQRR